jgi:ribosomal protein S18 acetylase RimI-like enzyme
VDDLPATAAVAAAAFEFDLDDPSVGDRWRGRVAYVLSTDPDGAFLAESDGRVVGVAQALKRERLWSLSLLAVRPDAQAAGVGRALLERSLPARRR